MEKVVTICDRCGKTKGETNRWFKLFSDNKLNKLAFSTVPILAPEKWAHQQDFCGEECFIAAISEMIKSAPK